MDGKEAGCAPRLGNPGGQKWRGWRDVRRGFPLMAEQKGREVGRADPRGGEESKRTGLRDERRRCRWLAESDGGGRCAWRQQIGRAHV